jgi:hypothetical protein
MGSLKERLKKNKSVMHIYGKVLDLYCCTLTDISPLLNSKVRFKNTFGYSLQLNKTQTLNEKLMWLKLNNYNKNPLIYKCADKFGVREYVRDCGCEELLNDLIGIYDSPDEIKWEALPHKFVVKWNFGSGMNVICYDKEAFDIEKARKKLEIWGNTKVWRRFSEMQYKYAPKKIIIEKFIESTSTDLPIDYKIFCFHGKPQIISEYIRDKETFSVIRNYFDFDWKPLACVDQSKCDDASLFSKPGTLAALFKYAEILSKPFPFVRVDFYESDGKVIFGELTFTPTACMCPQYTPSGDIAFGKLLDLSKVEML